MARCAVRLLLGSTLLAAAAFHPPTAVPRTSSRRLLSGVQMMAKKPKIDPRVWLPKRASPFAREVDVALQLVSRAVAGVGQVPTQVANIAAQALVCDGIASEFADDTVMACESAQTLGACDAETQKAALALINEQGATTPCVNAFAPPYPDPVKATELADADLGATLDKGAAKALSSRTWLLAPLDESEQPALSLTLLEYGRPVVCAVALPQLARCAMSGEKLLRMTVSFDGQSGAVAPPIGTILWAEENIGAYERSVAGEHGTDVPIRVDRSLIGKRDIASGQVTGVQDFGDVTWCESAAQKRAASLATELGISNPPLQAGGPFAYGLIARGEAQAYFDLPDSAGDFDSKLWAHAAGSLLVKEAGGSVTDTAGVDLDFSVNSDGAFPPQVVGVLATNLDVHPGVVRQVGLTSMEASAK